MANEVELKLRIAKSDIPRLKRHPAIKAAQTNKPITRKLLSIYYDTPQLKLLDHLISLRLRRISRDWIQTVKGKGSVQSGLHQRMEIESHVASGQFDFSQIANTEFSKIFDDEALRNALVPIFITEVQRTEWLLHFDNGDQIELALDVGELVVANEREPICEIELELKQGNTGRLFEFSLALQESISLTLENISKAQRGYAYYQHQLPSIVKANPPQLSRKMPAETGLKQIVWECLSQLQGNQEMVLHGDDIEGVHQMRIALRRLRSVLKIFGTVATKPRSTKMTEELRWITHVLGDARDIDVFVTQTLPPLLLQLQNQPSLILLADRADQERLKAYTALREAISSQRCQRLILTLGDWLENERWRETKTVEYTIEEIAQQILEKRYKRLRKHSKGLAQALPEERHAARIAAKNLRYAAEFFASLYSSSKSALFIKKLSQLQDHLGVLNDMNITNHLLTKLVKQYPNQNLEEGKHLLTGWNAYKLMLSIALMSKSCHQFFKQKAFWH
ncbi:MAG: CHAD domain-containing protein [Methylophilus sp.]